LGAVTSSISAGLKSGANEFFYFPNRQFEIREFTPRSIVIQKKTLPEQQFAIASGHVSPILVKFKAQRSIYIQDNDGYCLTINSSRDELESLGGESLNYIAFGEQNPPSDPFAARRTCQQRVSSSPHKDWFTLPYVPATKLLHFEIATNREVTFYLSDDIVDPHLGKRFMGNYGFYNIVPANLADEEVLLAVLNSTFGYLMLEFGGRYMENRDGTISNETRVGDLQELPIINPAAIQGEFRDKAIKLIRKMGSREVRKIWEELAEDDRRELDRVFFTDVLGLLPTDILEIYDTLAAITRQRNTKKR
jgi:hypothetical protein